VAIAGGGLFGFSGFFFCCCCLTPLLMLSLVLLV
jgi:hypothetical protein